MSAPLDRGLLVARGLAAAAAGLVVGGVASAAVAHVNGVAGAVLAVPPLVGAALFAPVAVAATWAEARLARRPVAAGLLVALAGVVAVLGAALEAAWLRGVLLGGPGGGWEMLARAVPADARSATVTGLCLGLGLAFGAGPAAVVGLRVAGARDPTLRAALGTALLALAEVVLSLPFLAAEGSAPLAIVAWTLLLTGGTTLVAGPLVLCPVWAAVLGSTDGPDEAPGRLARALAADDVVEPGVEPERAPARTRAAT